jgi:hypothetical protein
MPLHQTASWVVTRNATGEIMFETFDHRLVECLNTQSYTATPILEWLHNINTNLKTGAADA